MSHTVEDEERLFKRIEETGRRIRELHKKLDRRDKEIEDEEFNELIKKAEKKEDN